MLCALKVTAALLVLVGTLASCEEVEMTTAAVEESPQQPDAGTEAEESPKEDEGPAKTQGKRGLFRVTGVHGENLQPYQFFYTVPQQSPAASYQPLSMGSHHYEPRSVGTSSVPTTLLKPYPMPYAQPSYQPYVITSPSQAPLHAPTPYNAAPSTTMVLLMMPPHPGNPLGSLMLVPYNNIVPQPFVQSRVPVQLVPQYFPVPVKGYGQASGFPAAHFKTSDYPQKQYIGSQYFSTPEYTQKALMGSQYISTSDYSQKPSLSQQYVSNSEYAQKPSLSQQYVSSSEYSQKPSLSQQYVSSSEYAQKPSLNQQYFSGSEYTQKPSLSQQYLSSQYQEQPMSSEEQDSGATSPPSYASRPVDYKG